MLLGLVCDVPYIFSFCILSLIYDVVRAIYCVMENCDVQYSEMQQSTTPNKYTTAYPSTHQNITVQCP